MDFFEENRTAILALGLTFVLGRQIAKGLRPIAKSAIKGYLRARDALRGSGEVVAEALAEE